MWHLSTRIRGELLNPNLNVMQLACLLHPTPALCGFPTESARQLIADLEPHDRGLFSGIVGWCDANGDGEWAIVIRSGLAARQPGTAVRRRGHRRRLDAAVRVDGNRRQTGHHAQRFRPEQRRAVGLFAAQCAPRHTLSQETTMNNNMTRQRARMAACA